MLLLNKVIMFEINTNLNHNIKSAYSDFYISKYEIFQKICWTSTTFV